MFRGWAHLKLQFGSLLHLLIDRCALLGFIRTWNAKFSLWASQGNCALSSKKERKREIRRFAVETQSQSQSPNTSEPECFEDNAWWKEETLSWHVARRCININAAFSQNVCTLCPPWDKLKLKDISISLILLLSLLKLVSRILITFCKCNAAALCWEITIAFLVSGLRCWYAQLI